MTYLRTTEYSMSTRVMTNLQRSLSRVGETQEHLSSGKIITRPSDDPAGTAAAMHTRVELRSEQQYLRNADDGKGWLDSLEGAMTNASSIYSKVKELALQGSSSGAGGSKEARSALAAEVRQLRDSLLGVANTTYLGRPVFGGTTSESVAYDENFAYKGDTLTVQRTIGSNSVVDVNVIGPKAFGETDTAFAIFKDIADHLEAGDMTALGADTTKLDTVATQMRNRLADVGARYNRIEAMRTMADDRIVSLTSELSEFEDIDLPQTIMDLNLRQTSYQAALAATAKVIQPSLVDFLK